MFVLYEFSVGVPGAWFMLPPPHRAIWFTLDGAPGTRASGFWGGVVRAVWGMFAVSGFFDFAQNDGFGGGLEEGDRAAHDVLHLKIEIWGTRHLFPAPVPKHGECRSRSLRNDKQKGNGNGRDKNKGKGKLDQFFSS